MSYVTQRESKMILHQQSQQLSHHSTDELDTYSLGTHGKLKSIVELLNDRIASFAARNDNKFAAEFGKLTIENDMVTTFLMRSTNE